MSESVGGWSVGASAEHTFDMTEALIDQYAALSGDFNPIHMKKEAANASGFPRRVAHGWLSGAFLFRIVGMTLPGPGVLVQSMTLDWKQPLFPGDRVTAKVTVTKVSVAAQVLVLGLSGTTATGALAFSGTMTVQMSNELAKATVAAPAAVSEARTAAEVKPVVVPGARTITGSGPPVLVTGGARGIGRAIAEELARRGHPVALGYATGAAEAESAAAAIRAQGGRAVTFGFDLASDQSPRAALERLAAELGPIGGLVHAATPSLDRAAASESVLPSVERYLKVYVGGALSLLEVLLPSMKAAKHGRVVFLGTSALFGAPPPNMAAYVTGKSALLGLMKSLSVELGPSGITCNMVSPGLTVTDLTRDTSPRQQLAEAQRIPLRRLAQVQDTARVVASLLGEDGAFISGAHLPVTGGPV
ncbi:MAG: SDR family oxidoreductase [Myxococcaceae bacterium]|nr:SDR family oxidoreductase [Myxococcaceae bacterium]